MRTERPILFSAPMVRAILEGRKTQTRRILKHDGDPPKIISPMLGRDNWFFTDPVYDRVGTSGHPCPHGEPGDRLWVREAWANFGGDADLYQKHKPGVAYRATWDSDKFLWPDFAHHVTYVPGDKWRPSIFMPRWASRITLEITEIRAQRLRDISEADALSEGTGEPSLCELGGMLKQAAWSERQVFQRLWDHINAKRGFGWDKNPWVWALTFRKVDPHA